MSIYRIDNAFSSVGSQVLDIENNDPSLNGKGTASLENTYRLNIDDLNQTFLSAYGIEYVSEYFGSRGLEIQVVTHPYSTNTCYEKALLLKEWDPLNVIKALYFQSPAGDTLYAVVIPETGCFVDRERLRDILNLQPHGHVEKARVLPHNMSFGTCSPFITRNDLRTNGGTVGKILFDRETLINKRNTKSLDDFSFGLDHRMSLQMNYYHCYRMLKSQYPDVVSEQEILNLSFKGKLVRNKGRVSIVYEFHSLNYRSAEFINSTYGYGDVSIMNDYVDELDLPEVLTIPRKVE